MSVGVLIPSLFAQEKINEKKTLTWLDGWTLSHPTLEIHTWLCCPSAFILVSKNNSFASRMGHKRLPQSWNLDMGVHHCPSSRKMKNDLKHVILLARGLGVLSSLYLSPHRICFYLPRDRMM